VRSYRNPFRVRTSEVQHRQGAALFLNTYGPAVLDLLPDDIWDRLFVIRSAPGGGKTSLMKLFEAETLWTLHDRRDKFTDLADRLTGIGALGAEGPALVGVRIDLRRNYRALLDLAGPPQLGERLFLKLINARITIGVLAAALTLTGRAFPADVGDVRVGAQGETGDALERLGGASGQALFDRAREAESEILDLVDSLMPVSAEALAGHADLHALHALQGATLAVGDNALAGPLLVMFDDGQDLHSTQRRALIDRLVDRRLPGPRWYAERLQALSVEEVIGDQGPRERDVRVLELEATARRGLAPDGRPGSRKRSFDPLLLDIADRRARRPLQIYGEESDDFNTLVDVDSDELLGDRREQVLATLRAKVEAASGGDRRYERWIEHVAGKRGYEAALGWRELEILIDRDRDRPQGELFDVELDPGAIAERSSSSVREAAACFIAHDFRLPYYAGTQKLPKLASFNIEQFLDLGASLFEEMLALITLGRTPDISARRQDTIVRHASDDLWADIPQRYSHGRDIQRLLGRMAEMCRRETFRPKAPYPPGVTGTAISLEDRARLLDTAQRSAIDGADRLYLALGQAIAFNLLEVEDDYSVKGRRWMVLYLNRLLCPRFDLPLGRGGFRERKLDELATWVLPETSASREPAPDPDASPQLQL
jgi:hypothetical protein